VNKYTNHAGHICRYVGAKRNVLEEGRVRWDIISHVSASLPQRGIFAGEDGGESDMLGGAGGRLWGKLQEALQDFVWTWRRGVRSPMT